MFQTDFPMRMAGRVREMLATHTPDEASRLALGRVRKALTDWKPGLILDPARLQVLLQTPLDGPMLEVERHFSLGWLAWLTEDLFQAADLLTEAFHRCPQDGNNDWFALSAYWRARVRVLLHQTEALADYEAVLRTLKGSPQATAWFVDLLWRAGRVDRAEQVWKSVRANKKVIACEEGPLLEARWLLRRGDLGGAEKSLNEATPQNGVLQVERCLLLAWISMAQNQLPKVLRWLEQADRGPYPASARQRWRSLMEWRTQASRERERPEATAPEAELQSALLQDLVRGQRALLEGKRDEALAALEQARTNPVAEPFARYALACLGREDPAAILAGQPGLFLAVRCRARQALERFRTRQASPAELLEALHAARAARFSDPAAEHFQQLAQLLQLREPSLDDFRALFSPAADAPTSPVQQRNLFRAALETAVRRLPPVALRELLREWAQLPWLEKEPQLLVMLAQPLLRLILQQGSAEGPDRALLERLTPGEPLLGLLHPSAVVAAGAEPSSPPIALLQAARSLAVAVAEGWQDQVRRLRESGRWKGLAQALLVQEAAQRGDVGAAAALLEEVDCWRDLKKPPRFVLRALLALVSRNPTHPAWKGALPRWLALWEQPLSGPEGLTLAALAGLTPPSPQMPEPPPGVPAPAWYCHLTARALTSRTEDPSRPLACINRILGDDPDGTALPEADLLREAWPVLQRHHQAHALALLVGSGSHLQPVPAGLLVDAVDLLQSFPEGQALCEALSLGDNDAAAIRLLHSLYDSSQVPPRLLHHLTLLALRPAQQLEEADQTAQAEPFWRRAWQALLRWLADPVAAGITAEDRTLLLDWLLGVHRGHIKDLLARGEVDRARRHWNLVQELPEKARLVGQAFQPDLSGPNVRLESLTYDDLAQRLVRFRDDLAGEYLVATREAMRYGTIPEGMRADYDKGLTYLRRLLSLDNQSVRLLTVLVEICGEYFLDLYHAGNPSALVEQVERFTPFALQLARMIEKDSAALPARAALAEFCKFRGFITRDRQEKLALYREALRFNPANENVRQLLDDLEGSASEEGMRDEG